ncbi:sigma-70 family RNA polymerase sigma factor [Candidatus Soleaferrea massiliensis]|uniref:sigma-70 family RNA polymerase sigma factor n=1 Tax=Candidatus Soleaferrea massiliensis TaxID=1470354 RepID=UPI00058D1E8C|nr:sigma-70 family RNA polymerase sigma factor [Candidatus Soleaferrea massiliensis]
MNKSKLMYLQDIDVVSAYTKISSYDQDSEVKREQIIRTVKQAIQNELTERQRDCLTLYYFGNQTVEEIAQRYHLNRSTVSRHLKSARLRLKRVLQYYLYS